MNREVQAVRVRSDLYASPERYRDRALQSDALVRAHAHDSPFLGVPDWKGPLSYGNCFWDTGGEVITTELEHGHIDRGPILRVRLSVQDPALNSLERRPPGGSHSHPRRRTDTLNMTDPHDRGRLDVAGQPVDVDLWREGTSWWATGRWGGLHLALQCSGKDISQVRLVRVTDLEPWIRGHHELLEERLARARLHQA